MTDLNRRALLGGLASLAMAGGMSEVQARCPPDPRTVCNVTHLYSIPMERIVEVRDVDDIRRALRSWEGAVSIGGGRYSMGGQTAIASGLQLDMRGLRGLVHLDAERRTVRVQAGMRWRALQALIDPYGLAVRTMQSFSNFTVGGAISVNCHGRYVGHGPIVSSVRALQLVMADGEVLEATPVQNAELFHAAIGGYGGVGVVTEVELALDENFSIERSTARVRLEDYPSWFRQTVASDPSALLHNADLLPADFSQPYCVTWRRSSKALTEQTRLRAIGGRHLKEQVALWAMTELPGGTAVRRGLVQPLQDRPAVVWRNYEASLDVTVLEPANRNGSTYVLQEYFVPERHFVAFARQMAALLQNASTGTLNVSIRHAPADTHTLMAWAREDVFSFVVYYKQSTAPQAQHAVAAWTRAMIALALAHGGSYYLPYQLHATREQFASAYPRAAEFRALRQSIGANRLRNTLWESYL